MHDRLFYNVYCWNNYFRIPHITLDFFARNTLSLRYLFSNCEIQPSLHTNVYIKHTSLLFKFVQSHMQSPSYISLQKYVSYLLLTFYRNWQVGKAFIVARYNFNWCYLHYRLVIMLVIIHLKSHADLKNTKSCFYIQRNPSTNFLRLWIKNH